MQLVLHPDPLVVAVRHECKKAADASTDVEGDLATALRNMSAAAVSPLDWGLGDLPQLPLPEQLFWALFVTRYTTEILIPRRRAHHEATTAQLAIIRSHAEVHAAQELARRAEAEADALELENERARRQLRVQERREAETRRAARGALVRAWRAARREDRAPSEPVLSEPGSSASEPEGQAEEDTAAQHPLQERFPTPLPPPSTADRSVQYQAERDRILSLGDYDVNLRFEEAGVIPEPRCLSLTVNGHMPVAAVIDLAAEGASTSADGLFFFRTEAHAHLPHAAFDLGKPIHPRSLLADMLVGPGDTMIIRRGVRLVPAAPGPVPEAMHAAAPPRKRPRTEEALLKLRVLVHDARVAAAGTDTSKDKHKINITVQGSTRVKTVINTAAAALKVGAEQCSLSWTRRGGAGGDAAQAPTQAQVLTVAAAGGITLRQWMGELIEDAERNRGNAKLKLSLVLHDV